MEKTKFLLAFVAISLVISSPCHAEEWAMSYGGSNSDKGYSVQQIPDGGYIVAGETESFGARDSDSWILKLNSDGSVAWQKTYGGSSRDSAHFIQGTSDGSYVVAGQTESFGAGDSDSWILKLNSDGSVAWQKIYGGASRDSAHFIQGTSDGSYVVAGQTESFGAGDADFWVLKLNSDGSVAWQKTYGGDKWDGAYCIQQTLDRGYIVAGFGFSFGSDLYVLKLDLKGEITNCTAMGTSEATIFDTSVVGEDTSVVPQESSAIPMDTAVVPNDTMALMLLACRYSIRFGANQEIFYGGYLDKTQEGVLADTLITVTHSNVKRPVPVKIVVYDKHGAKVAEASLLNGGEPLEDHEIPIRGLGWTTLGLIVNRVTKNPLGVQGGEKFSCKIATGTADYTPKPTFIDVTQVIYNSRQQNSGEAIWNPANIAARSQTALGGKCGTGLITYPSEWD